MRKRHVPPPAPFQRTYLREWRKRAGLSLESAGAVIGLDHSQLSRIERGEAQYMQEHLEAAAKLYGTTTSDLISRSPDEAADLFGIWPKLTEPQKRRAIRLIEAIKGEE